MYISISVLIFIYQQFFFSSFKKKTKKSKILLLLLSSKVLYYIHILKFHSKIFIINIENNQKTYFYPNDMLKFLKGLLEAPIFNQIKKN